MNLRPAERKRQHLRIALAGPPGSGKTFTALRIAHALGGPIGVVDTENGSAELYAGEPNPDGGVFAFATIDLASEPGKFSVDNYVKALRAMAAGGIRTVIVDSGSHAWAGTGGVLEFVDEVARRQKTPNKYVAWGEGTPKHNEWLQALLTYPGHLLVTLRTKVEYSQEKDDRGKTTIKRLGLAPVQREGIDYEWTVAADLEQDTHRLIVTKSRCSALADRSFDRPGADVAQVLLAWLDGAAVSPPSSSQSPAESAASEARPSEGGPRHDPSWPRDCKRFFAEVGKLGEPTLGKYEAWAPWCEEHSWPGRDGTHTGRPSTLTQPAREALYQWLRSPDHRTEVLEWVARQDEAQSAAGGAT